MKPTYIVYCSNTGFTARYAKMLSEKLGIPACPLMDPAVPKGSPVIFMGWVMAGMLRGYKKAANRYDVRCACGVSLAETGAQTETIRKSARIPAEIPVFTLQGGMDHGKLTGIYKKMIETLVKMLSKKQRTEEEDAMLEMIKAGGDFVREENLSGVLAWMEEQK